MHVPQTRPSHACLMTGRLPYEHGIRDNYSRPLPANLPTLASVLAAAGWDTAALRRRLPGVAPLRPRPRLRPLRRSLRRGRRDDERGPHRASRRGGRRPRPRVAREAADEAVLRLGAPLRPARAVRGPGPVRRAVREAPVRRGGGLRRRPARRGSSPGSTRAACGSGRWWSSPPTTARASATTARPSTCSSSTTRRCGSRSSSRGRGRFRPAASSRGSSAAST